jgi:hypothetical protein
MNIILCTDLCSILDPGIEIWCACGAAQDQHFCAGCKCLPEEKP